MPHQVRGHADRQLQRQLQAIQLERGQSRRLRRLAGVQRELVAQLRQLALQARQRRPRLSQRSSLGQHVGARDRAQVESPFHDLELVLLQLFDFPGGLDLGPQ